MPVVLMCPHCGYEELVEEEVLNDDERTCYKCGKYVFDEEDDVHH